MAERGGRRAETAALLYLLGKFYWPVARRAKTPRGEIDLIVKRGRQIVLVEVKARPSLEEGHNAIGERQQHRIIDAFAWWLARNPAYTRCDARCDALLIAPGRWPRHIKNAFSA